MRMWPVVGHQSTTTLFLQATATEHRYLPPNTCRPTWPSRTGIQAILLGHWSFFSRTVDFYPSQVSLFAGFQATSNTWDAYYCDRCSDGVVYLSVCQSLVGLRPAKTVNWSKSCLDDLRNIALDGDLDLRANSMRPSPSYSGHLFIIPRNTAKEDCCGTA